jgi:hypothetical protein
MVYGVETATRRGMGHEQTFIEIYAMTDSRLNGATSVNRIADSNPYRG